MLTLLVCPRGEEEKAAMIGEEVGRACPGGRLCLLVPEGADGGGEGIDRRAWIPPAGGDLAGHLASALATPQGLIVAGEPVLILSPALGSLDSGRVHGVLAALTDHPERLAVSARRLDGNLHPVMLRHLPGESCDADGAVVPAGGAANIDWAGVVTPESREFFPAPHLAGGSQFLPELSVVDGAVAACTAGILGPAEAGDRRRWLAVCDEDTLCRPIAGQV